MAAWHYFYWTHISIHICRHRAQCRWLTLDYDWTGCGRRKPTHVYAQILEVNVITSVKYKIMTIIEALKRDVETAKPKTQAHRNPKWLVAGRTWKRAVDISPLPPPPPDRINCNLVSEDTTAAAAAAADGMQFLLYISLLLLVSLLWLLLLLLLVIISVRFTTGSRFAFCPSFINSPPA